MSEQGGGTATQKQATTVKAHLLVLIDQTVVVPCVNDVRILSEGAESMTDGLLWLDTPFCGEGATFEQARAETLQQLADAGQLYDWMWQYIHEPDPDNMPHYAIVARVMRGLSGHIELLMKLFRKQSEWK